MVGSAILSLIVKILLLCWGEEILLLLMHLILYIFPELPQCSQISFQYLSLRDLIILRSLEAHFLYLIQDCKCVVFLASFKCFLFWPCKKLHSLFHQGPNFLLIIILKNVQLRQSLQKGYEFLIGGEGGFCQKGVTKILFDVFSIRRFFLDFFFPDGSLKFKMI